MPGSAEDDSTLRLPVLCPEPDDVLAAAAMATPLVGRVLTLAGWLGSGRALTSAKVLRPAEAAQAVAQLGLDRPVLPPDQGLELAPFSGPARQRRARVRSAKDLPDLHPIWCAAVAADLIEIRGQRAVPGPGLAVWQEPSEPSRQLESWARMLAGFFRAQIEVEQADHSGYLDDQHSPLSLSVMMLYTAAEAPLWPGMLAIGALIVLGDGEDADLMQLLALPEAVTRWATVLEQWAVAGVLAASEPQDPGESGSLGEELEQFMTQLEGLLGEVTRTLPGAAALLAPVFDAMRKGPIAEVTSFGRYALAHLLRAQGLPVPTVGDLVDASPDELLDALSDYEPEVAVEEIHGWLDARGDAWEDALRGIIRAAATSDDAGPMRRAVLPTVIGLVAEAAGPILREWKDDPWVAAPVALGRYLVQRGPQPTVAQFLWLAVDALSMGLDDEDEFVDLMESTQVEVTLAEPGAIALAPRLDHPRTREVLRLLVRHLEDRQLAGRLRRALHGGAGGRGSGRSGPRSHRPR